MLLISYQSTYDMQGQFNYGKFRGIHTKMFISNLMMLQNKLRFIK